MKIEQSVIDGFRLWQKAQSALRDIMRFPPDRHTLVMQVTVLPSRPPDAGTAYSLLKSSDGNEAPYVLVCCAWDAEADLAVLQNAAAESLEPSLVSRKVIVDPERARALEASLATLVIPLMPRKPLSGLDGTDVEVVVGGPFSQCRVTWWVESPEEWKELGVLVNTLIGWANP